MASLTVVIPTLGRFGLLQTLTQLKSWREAQPRKYQNFEILVFHNSKSSSSRALPIKVTDLINSLSASLIESEVPLEGAELSFREALRYVTSEYVLPFTDDNIFEEEGFKLALDIVAENQYDWVHFNSITNGRLNYLVDDLIRDTSAGELVSRIGLNYSLCCVSRSLFRKDMLDFGFWDSLLDRNQSVFSWSVVLAHSFHERRVALASIPIEIRKVHEYDKSMKKWHSQWKQHAVLNNDGFLFPFTIHLGKMYESLISQNILLRHQFPSMVVMEGNILKPLHVEMTNLVFLHAYKLKNNSRDVSEFLCHLGLLSSFFPKLAEIYIDIEECFTGNRHFKRKAQLRRIEFKYRNFVNPDGFGIMRVLGSGRTNVLLHPTGRLYVQDLYADSEWKGHYFIFRNSDHKGSNSFFVQEITKSMSLQFSLDNDTYYQLDPYTLTFPNKIRNRILSNQVLFSLYRVLPKRLRSLVVRYFLGGN